MATETDAESGVHQSPKGNNVITVVLFSSLFFPGSSLSSKDFANGAKYNKDYESQDNSSKRAHFEKAMRFHQVLAAGSKTPSPVLSCKNWDLSQGKMVY